MFRQRPFSVAAKCNKVTEFEGSIHPTKLLLTLSLIHHSLAPCFRNCELPLTGVGRSTFEMSIHPPRRAGPQATRSRATRRYGYCAGATANEVVYAFPFGGSGIGELGLAVRSPVV